MADVYDDYLSKQLEIEKALGSTSTAIYLMSEKYAILAKSVRDATTLNAAMEKGLAATVKAHIEGKKNLQDHITKLIALTKEQNAYVASQKKMQETVERGAKGLKGYLEDIDKLGAGAQNLIGKMGALAGTFGVTAMSLNSIIKTGIEFDKALFQLSRTQQVAGKGAQDMGAALAYVTKNTVLAKAQFVEFAKIIQNGFIGVKPSMMEIAEIAKLIGRQVGSSFEAQTAAATKLASVQSQFPALGEKIIAIMKAMDEIGSKPNDSDKRRIASLQRELVIRADATTASAEDLTKIRELTSFVTDEQNKLNEAVKKQAELGKAYREAELAFYKELQPYMMGAMKGIENIVKAGTEWKNTIIAVTAALTTMRGVMAIINVVASANPYIKIAAAVVSAGVAITAMFDWQKKSTEESKRAADLADLEIKRRKELGSLSKEQQKIYEDEWKNLDKSKMTTEELSNQHDIILNRIKVQNQELDKGLQEYKKIAQNVKEELVLLDKVSGALRTQSDLMEEFGGYSEEALKNLILAANLAKEQAGTGLKSILDNVKQAFENTPIKLNIDTGKGVGDQARQVMEQIASKVEQLNADISITKEGEAQNKLIAQKTKLLAEAVQLSDALKLYQEKEGAVTKSTISDLEKNVRLQEKFTSAYEARLDTERKLMESAQFGMGASVEMMKKQVELAYQLMKTYADTDKLFEQEAAHKTNASEADMKAIKNAKTQQEAQNYIYNVMKKQGDEAQLLLNYAVKHQEYSKKEMDQQQKIYELTKDIREGYLDAMRDMATGFGEFSKIIGTQEMGVTQLMSTVKGVTGKDTLNTFKLGGMQSSESVVAGVGTNVSGMYTTSGMAFESGSATEEKNKRITGYGQSVEDVRKVMQGDMSGRKATAGGATVEGRDNYVRAGEIVADKTGEKVKEGMIDGWDEISKSDRNFTRNVLGVNPAITSATGQVPNDASKIQSNGRTVGNQTAGYLGGSPSPTPAGNVFVPNVPGNRLPIPSETDATLGKLLAVNIKISEQDFKALKAARNMEDGQKILADLMRKQNATVELQGDEFKKLGISQNSEYKKIEGEPNEMTGPLANITSMQRSGRHTDYKGAAGAALTDQPYQTETTYVPPTKAAAAAAPIAPATPSAPPPVIPTTPPAAAGAKGDIWDQTAALENKGIEKAKEGALSPVAGVAAVGLGGKLVKSGTTRALLLKNAKMELAAAKFAAGEAAKLGPGAGTVLRDATYQAAEKAELSRQFAANSKNLNRLSTAGRMGSRIAGATSLVAGAGGSALGGDIADLTHMGDKGKLGMEIGGGVTASLAASAMPSMASLATGFAGVTAGAATAAIAAAGAVGYGAGKALDWGSGKITGKSMSARTGDFLTRNAWLGGGGEIGGYDPAAVQRMKRIKQNKEIRETAEAKKIVEAQKTKAAVVAEVKKQENKAVEETKKPVVPPSVAAITPAVKPPEESSESVMARAARGYQETRDKEEKAAKEIQDKKDKIAAEESQKGVFRTDVYGGKHKMNYSSEKGVFVRNEKGERVKMESAARPVAQPPRITKAPITTIEDKGYIGGKKVLDKAALARQSAYEKAEKMSKEWWVDDAQKAAAIKTETGISDFDTLQKGVKMRTDALGTSQLKEGRFKGPKATEKMVKEALFAEGGSYAKKLKDLTEPKEAAKGKTLLDTYPLGGMQYPAKTPELSDVLGQKVPWSPTWAKPLEVPGLSAEAPLYGPRIDPVKAKAEADTSAATSKLYSQSKNAKATFRSRLMTGTMDKAQIDKELAAAREADKVSKEAKAAAKEAKKTVEETGKKADEHEAKRGVTGGIIADPSAVATHKVSEIDAMAERGRAATSSGLTRGGKHVRGIGESSSKVRGIGEPSKHAPSRHVRGIGESGNVKSTFDEGGGDTYHKNLKIQAEKQEKEAQKVQKSSAPAQEAKKGAEKVATVEKARGQSKEEKEGGVAGAATQQAYVASAGQREAMFGTKAEGGGGGGGGTINVVIHLDPGLIAHVDKKIDAVQIVTNGVQQGAASVGKGST